MSAKCTCFKRRLPAASLQALQLIRAEKERFRMGKRFQTVPAAVGEGGLVLPHLEADATVTRGSGVRSPTVISLHETRSKLPCSDYGSSLQIDFEVNKSDAKCIPRDYPKDTEIRQNIGKMNCDLYRNV